jgi:hypothetical protein
VEAELTELLDLNQKQIEAMEAAQLQEDQLEDEASLDIYCTVDELREKANQFPSLDSTFVRNSINKFDDVNPVTDKRDALQEISLNKVSLAELSFTFAFGTHDVISWYGSYISHAPHNDVWVDRPHMQWWSHKIIM